MRRVVLVSALSALLLPLGVIPAHADGAEDASICQPGVTVDAPDLGGQSLEVVANPALAPAKCLLTVYEIVVVNTTTGITLDDQTLLSEQQYRRTFSLARGTNVTATITQGQGSATASGGVVAVAPAPPGSLVATAATQTSVSLQWEAPVDDGGSPVTSYSISWPGGTVGATDTQAVVTGLRSGTTYAFAVAASNAIGTGPQAMVSATTSAGPSPAPGPSPQPSGVAPAVVGNGNNTNGTHDADGNPKTIQQTTTATWPSGRLASGKPGRAVTSTTLVTNAGQQIVLGVTAVSPSIASASIVLDTAAKGYRVVASLKPGTVGGSVTVSAVAPGVTVGVQSYEPLQSSRLYVVKPR